MYTRSITWALRLGHREDASRREERTVADYRAKRENGTQSDKPDTKFPQDGKITWIKGTAKDDGYVYGVEENDGYYHYEVRYDEGLKDREWMQEKDRKYLARLKKEGKLEKEEPEEYKKIIAKQRFWEKLNEAREEKPSNDRCNSSDLIVKCEW